MAIKKIRKLDLVEVDSYDLLSVGNIVWFDDNFYILNETGETFLHKHRFIRLNRPCFFGFDNGITLYEHTNPKIQIIL